MDDDESPKATNKGKKQLSFEKYNSQKHKSLLNYSQNDVDSNGNDYIPIRDNVFFNRFALKYNEKLKQAFEEIDK